MGLDMEFYQSGVVPGRKISFRTGYNSDEPFAYWRNHWSLHNWLEKLYRFEGGEGTFNGESLELNLEDFQNLVADAANGTLYEDRHEWASRVSTDMEIFGQALEVIAQGGNVYYDCSW